MLDNCVIAVWPAHACMYATGRPPVSDRAAGWDIWFVAGLRRLPAHQTVGSYGGPRSSFLARRQCGWIESIYSPILQTALAHRSRKRNSITPLRKSLYMSGLSSIPQTQHISLSPFARNASYLLVHFTFGPLRFASIQPQFISDDLRPSPT